MCIISPCVVRKDTVYVGTKALSMRHQAQKGFRCIFVEIPQNQKGYIVYLSNKCKIVFSYDVAFGESFSSALAYTSQPCSEAMVMQPAVSCVPYDS